MINLPRNVAIFSRTPGHARRAIGSTLLSTIRTVLPPVVPRRFYLPPPPLYLFVPLFPFPDPLDPSHVVARAGWRERRQVREEKEEQRGTGGEGRRREERREEAGVQVPERERILLTVRERARGVSSACVGGPANNAGLVFLNPRGEGHRGAVSSGQGGGGGWSGHFCPRGGEREPRTFLFLLPPYPGVQHARAKTVSRSPACARERGRRGRGPDLPNELSRLLERREPTATHAAYIHGRLVPG